MLNLRLLSAKKFMKLGIYISVPFCRSKCTYCNFASGVFSAGQMGRYVERLCSDIQSSRALAAEHEAVLPDHVDSIYLGGGTPSLLPSPELTKLFAVIASEFKVTADAEITVECAPATLTQPILETLVSCGVTRVSLGVQSFVDLEAASVARLHTRDKVLDDIKRLRGAGISNINIDLIAGLPHQTRESWQYSLEQAIATGVPHISVYMLEVDEDSRLGRELMAGGTRYHAHFVPDDDLTSEFYEAACSELDLKGVRQYEISNFARAGFESRHNLKYWTRQPYFGFGVDAHSMLISALPESNAVRCGTPDALDQYVGGAMSKSNMVSRSAALEEAFFLGLRLNRGVNLDNVAREFGLTAVESARPVIAELAELGLLRVDGDLVR